MFGVELAQALEAEAHAGERAGAEVLGDRVRPGDQLLDQLAGARVVDVGGDAPLVAVEVVEDAGAVRVGVPLCRQAPAQRVHVPLVLDSDHVGPEVGDDARRLRPGDDPGEVHHADPGQGPGPLVVGAVAVRVALRHRRSPSGPPVRSALA